LLARRAAGQARSSPVGAVVEIPEPLRNPRAHRARACVRYLAAHPGASNRQVADALGVSGRTQMSALLARLHRAGLLVKHPARPGGPNAWSLTQRGLRASRIGLTE
jgi:predicted ArsR family transcriptional regulator